MGNLLYVVNGRRPPIMLGMLENDQLELMSGRSAEPPVVDLYCTECKRKLVDS